MSIGRENRRRETGPASAVLPPGVKAQMIIQVLESGKTKVVGPCGNRPLCEAMLNDAWNVIRAYNAKTEQDVLSPASDIVAPEPSKIIVPS